MTTADFVPLHIERSGTFELPCAPAEALGYLSAEGERAWVPGWEPVYLHPKAPSNAAGTVFRTRHNDQETHWLVLEFDPAAGRALYARLTEGSHLGTVRVECSTQGSGSLVRVSYSLTSMSPAGSQVLAAMTEQAYPAMLAEWRRLILAARSREVSAVVFDLDGVLYDFEPAHRAAYLAERTGLPTEQLAAVFTSSFELEAEAGAYASGAAYLAAFNTLLGTALSRDEWIEARRRAMRPRSAVLALAQRLAARVPVGVLTNNGALLAETMTELCPGLAEVMRDRCWVSCQLGARKPEPLAFARLAERLQLPVERILFVDDSSANCEGARRAGLQALHFREEAEILETLTGLLGRLSPG